MTRQQFVSKMEQKCLLLDGSYGVQLLLRGLRASPAEILTLTSPNAVEELQREYVQAGVDILSTHTFNANRLKLKAHGYDKDLEAFNRQAVKIAKRAASDRAWVFGNISSTGELLQPLGKISFEQAFENYREQVSFLLAEGVDGFLVETISDIRELKSIIVAIRSLDNEKPVIVNMTFEANGISLTGTSVENYGLTIQELDIDALGINCTLTPEESIPVFHRLSKVCSESSVGYRLTKPLCVEPNAGKPVYDGDTLRYDLSPEVFAFSADDFLDMGASIIGGCCGTGPEHIRLLRQKIDTYSKNRTSRFSNSSMATTASNGTTAERFITSRTVICPIFPFLPIGERVNPASKPQFQQQIQNREWHTLLKEVREQTLEGARVLDINLGIEKTLTPEHIREVILQLDAHSSIPLSLDIQTNDLLEIALREYAGRALMNSARVTPKSLDRKIEMLKKYGGMLILLAMGKEIPATAEERVSLVEEGIGILERNGIRKERIIVDPLVLSLGSGKDPQVTLQTIRKLTEKGIMTSIGLSNLSYGLPNRPGINAAFLAQAIEKGLQAAILNTGEETVRAVWKGAFALKGIELEAVGRYRGQYKVYGQMTATGDLHADSVVNDDAILEAMLDGDDKRLEGITDQLLLAHSPLEVSQGYLSVSMEKLGAMYSQGKIFLPQLLLAADTAQKIFENVNAHISAALKYKGRVLLATVEGDVHDIGKKIVATVFKSGGYEVIDLGKDISAESIILAAKEYVPDIIGLSAMMTTTIGEIEVVAKLLQQNQLSIPLIAGGASLNKSLAEKFGCTGYARDAAEGLQLCNRIIKKGRA